jgi:crotonobetaine/carnitine-CoA ligase
MRTPLEVLRLYRDHDYSLRDLVESRAERGPSRPLIWSDGVEWSWAQVQGRAAGAAAALAAQGVRHGDRIAIMARNSPDHVILLLALGRLGAIMVPVNPEFGVGEARFVLGHADVGGVLVSADTIGTVRAAVAEMEPKPRLISVDGATEATPAFADLIDANKGRPAPDAGKADDPVIIIFTSGSTGFPKAVLHSQRNFLTAGEAFISRVRLQETDRLMIVLPMYHINAMFYSVAGTLAAGASMAVVPKFSASRFWETAVESQATEANIIEAMGAILKERPRSEFRPEHRIRAIYGVRPWLIETFDKEFHVQTCVGGYGMSEIPGVISTPLDRPNAPGSMGVVGSHPDPARSWADWVIWYDV